MYILHIGTIFVVSMSTCMHNVYTQYVYIYICVHKDCLSMIYIYMYTDTYIHDGLHLCFITTLHSLHVYLLSMCCISFNSVYIYALQH